MKSQYCDKVMNRLRAVICFGITQCTATLVNILENYIVIETQQAKVQNKTKMLL